MALSQEIHRLPSRLQSPSRSFDTAEQVKVAGERLTRRVRFARFRVATGFAGTPLVTYALTIGGQSQVAYRMLLEKQCPSWLYPVAMGATIIWERWDSMLPGGTINPGQNDKLQPLCLGVYRELAPQMCGWYQPHRCGLEDFKGLPGSRRQHRLCGDEVPYGLISCSCSITSDRSFSMNLTVPPNSAALVVIKDQSSQTTC